MHRYTWPDVLSAATEGWACLAGQAPLWDEDGLPSGPISEPTGWMSRKHGQYHTIDGALSMRIGVGYNVGGYGHLAINTVSDDDPDPVRLDEALAQMLDRAPFDQVLVILAGQNKAMTEAGYGPVPNLGLPGYFYRADHPSEQDLRPPGGLEVIEWTDPLGRRRFRAPHGLTVPEFLDRVDDVARFWAPELREPTKLLRSAEREHYLPSHDRGRFTDRATLTWAQGRRLKLKPHLRDDPEAPRSFGIDPADLSDDQPPRQP